MKAFTAVAVTLTTLALVGCGVHQTEAPPLTGPSELALSISVLAVPDSISQDGGSQSSIKVTAFGPNGKGQSNVGIRLDMRVNGVAQDYGTLSARNLVTKADGSADPVVYTAPPSPPNGLFGTCDSLPGTCVEIVASATATNFATSNPQSVRIRLVPPGVILPPADTPTPKFSFSPTSPAAKLPVLFDGSASCAGSSACSSTSGITNFAWNFGDGTFGSGVSVSHTFQLNGTFNVTLTVTNSSGVQASTSNPVAVGAGTQPTADFVFSPSAPVVNQSINFDASQARAGLGHSIASYAWNFGDGTTKTGVTTTHDYASAGTFNVTLTVRDEVGQATTGTKSVSVLSSSGGGGATVAIFSFSPLTPSALQPVFFNASASSAATGHTLTTYAWNFGDGTLISGATVSATHTFTAAGTFTVTLTVTDDIGQTGIVATPLTVAAAGAGSLTADFSISPTDPTSGQLVSFNANLSSPAASITSYDWDFGDGTVVNGQSSFLITHTYFTVTGNTYAVRLTVHDNTGRVATNLTPHSVTVKPGTDPIARFTVSPSPATVGATVAFDGSASTGFPGAAGPPVIPPKTIASYQWDFGDGSPIVTTVDPTKTTTHSYAATGTYTIRLTVIDTAGLSSATTRTLLVQ